MNKTISVVIPVYNEKENLDTLYEELIASLKALNETYEIIFVDDGSSDGSASVIKDIARKDNNARAVIFKRNFGQTAAIVAGIDAAKGEYIVTMDADLQNDPRDISVLMKKIKEGYDLVSGWRRKRKDSFLKRRLPSVIANRFISFFTGLKLHDYGCTLKIYKRDSLKDLNLYGEMHRFIPVYVYWLGGKVAEAEVNHRKRTKGKSKYGIGRTLKVVLDLITVRFLVGDYSTSPLYFFGRWSFITIAAGILCAAYVLLEKIIWGTWVHKNPLFILSIFCLMIGTQIILMGLLAEISIRIYYETTKKSIYTVSEKLNC